MYIKVNETHQRIDFECINPTCDQAKQRPTDRVTAKMVRISVLFSIFTIINDLMLKDLVDDARIELTKSSLAILPHLQTHDARR